MDNGKVFERLLQLAVGNNIVVRFAPLKYSYARIKGSRLAIRHDLDIERINYNLAHEIAHAYLHFDKGDTINSEKHPEYEEQAERGARMLLDVLSV